LKEYPTFTSPRFRIEHAQIIDPKDIPRFANLGVIPSMQATHATSDMPWVHARVGEDLAKKGAYAWRALIKGGAKIANGSDAPVESIAPIPGFYAAVTRQDSKGNPPGGWHPEQRMTREEALRSFTSNGAYAAFEENEKGSLAVGKLADLVVLSQDILRVPAEKILATKILFTVTAGKIVYERRE
jgi:predicted amidohydrolase YtcJ